MMKLILFSLYFIMIILSFATCESRSEKQLNNSLIQAKDNREEIEKVLAHYTDDPEKLAAARFLVINTPGHLGIDSSYVKSMLPVYEKHAEISRKYNWERSSEWQKEIDTLWINDKKKVGPFLPRQDIQTVKADWLINEVDRSFKAWQENAYTKNDSFEDFCRYILPYRFAEGLCLDNSRDVFYNRHAHFFNDLNKDFRAVRDSLHQQYNCI